MKKLFALVLAFCLVLTMVPAPAFAEGEPEAPVCTCDAACTAEKKNTGCPVCGEEGAAPESCGKYAAPEPEEPRETEKPVTPEEPEKPTEPVKPTEPEKPAEPTPAQKVQALINALPDAVTAENREAVEAQLTAIDEAKLPLTDEERATLDFVKYDAAIAAINVLDNQPGAEVPKTLEGEEKQNILSFDANDGIIVFSELSTPEASIQIPTNYSADRYEYAFVGWNTEKNGGGTSYQPGETYNFTAANNGEKVTLYAQWKSTKNAPDSNAMNVLGNSYLAKITALGSSNTVVTRVAKDFVSESSLDGNDEDGYTLTVSFDTKPYEGLRAEISAAINTQSGTTGEWYFSSNQTLPNVVLKWNATERKWEPQGDYLDNVLVTYTMAQKYTVTYTDGADGEELFKDQSYEVLYGETAPAFAGTPSRDGFTFIGWSPEPGKVTGKTTYTAQWGYTITLNPNGGTVPSTTVTTNAEGKLSPYPKATRDGYVFDCWYTQPTGGEFINTEHVFAENTTLYAHWLEVIPEIGFSMSGYGNGMTVSGLKLTLEKGNKGVASDYSQYGVNYWISLDAHTGAGTPIDSSAKFSEENTYHLWVKVELKKGYDAGWPSNFTLNGNKDEAYTMENYVYTVVFQLPTVGYAITLDPNGGKLPEGTDSTVVTDAGGKLTSLPTPTREGYSFDGWYTAKASGDKFESDNFFQKNTTLYAHWKADTYTVHFDANGGTGTMADQTMTYGQTTKLTVNGFSRSGYRFTGWTTHADGTGLLYGDQEPVSYLTATNGGTVTLYAQWVKVVDRVDLTLSGHVHNKSVEQVKVTTKNDISFQGPDYDDGWGITTNKDTLTTLSGKLFQADTQYYLWVKFYAKEGCTLEGLTAKDVTLDGKAALSLTNMQGTMTAVFRLPVIYTITVTAGKNGSVSSDSTIDAKGEIAVFEGEDVTIKITPDSGYVVYRLTVDDTNVKTARSYTFGNIQQSHTLKARFLKNGDNAKTGDSFPLFPAMALLTLSTATLAAAVIMAKKKQKK